jgi:hypothetical protein
VNSPAGWDVGAGGGAIGAAGWLGVRALGDRPGCGVDRIAAGGGATSAGNPENALVNPLADGAGDGVGSGRAGLNAGCSRCASHEGRS